MADIRNWPAFIRGRWDWTRSGYERGFPRGCQFTDIDAAVEFDGHSLLIEAKSHNDEDVPLSKNVLSKGQRLLLEDEVKRGKNVFVLFGCGCCNNPYGLWDFGQDELFDWRGWAQKDRRALLKQKIDEAMGVGP